ncbi:efflux transporter outer membrane subunit [Xylophilus rhododendri]|uniref:Efflux transporter outer membrane subunit n=1 Tax=Xylophilus rhododendri TaxID=2697032 RepID=A0A857J4X9_9BURK|nr:efflux transporter outer membrane subunit [Xylophilus rhododendri]QHI98866.1 efflux transporter outer membrane subunit [Xylophilus rhododendri]
MAAFRFLLSTLSLAALAGCMMGPDYRGAPDAAPHASAAAAFQRADAALETPAPPPSRWWEALEDPQLTRLIDQALASSPNLQAAEARIRQARATLQQRRSAALPGATATGAAIKASVPGNSPLAALGGSSSSSSSSSSSAETSSGHRTIDFYSAGFDAMWEIDLFGGVRRGIEGAAAQTDAAIAQYQDAQVQMAAEVGQAYASLRGLQRQLALGRSNAELQQRMLALTEARRRGGTADELDLERARAQLTSTQADIVPLPGRIQETLDQLALLTGQEPGALDAELGPPAPPPRLPATVAVGDPAAMLRRRPDVRAAERTLAAGNAAIGQAIAQRFPKVTLFGNIGFSSSSASDLFHHDKLAVLGGPILQWNFLDFGANRARVNQSRAAYDEADARYRQAVLAALQDAEQGISRFRSQRDTLEQLVASRDSATRAARLAQLRWRGGTISQLDALDAERQRLQAEDGLTQGATALLTQYVSLQKSLGLGWSEPPQRQGEPVAAR